MRLVFTRETPAPGEFGQLLRLLEDGAADEQESVLICLTRFPAREEFRRSVVAKLQADNPVIRARTAGALLVHQKSWSTKADIEAAMKVLLAAIEDPAPPQSPRSTRSPA